jgi:acetyl esterase
MLSRAVRGRIERSVAQLLFNLPHRTQVMLSLKPPIKIAGQTLHPEMQLLLATRERMRAGPLRAETPEKARHRMRREVLRHPPSRLPPVVAHELTIDGGGGPLRARHYRPKALGIWQPLIVFFHGGGFVTGDLDTHDSVCRLLSDSAEAHVLAVDYRLAPEHPFPAAVEDARAALRWAFQYAESLGADPRKIAVAGDSAGGNLAAVVSQAAARDGGPAPALQLLIYPLVDRSRDWPSQALFSEGFLLTNDDMRWYDMLYSDASPETFRDPRMSPLLARDLSCLCPAIVVTAGFDPLRDQGEAYAAALNEAGTHTTVKRLDGLIHGFVNMVGVSPAARDAVTQTARMVKSFFGNNGVH